MTKSKLTNELTDEERSTYEAALHEGRQALMGHFSKLALAVHLLKMKAPYDKLYGTGHGGDRTKQEAAPATCFSEYVAQTHRTSARTARDYVRQAASFMKIDADFRKLAHQTSLANQPGMAERIGVLPASAHEEVLAAFQVSLKAGTGVLLRLERKHRPKGPTEKPKKEKKGDSPVRRSTPSFPSSGQLEGHPRKTSDGIEVEFEDAGVRYRVVVSKNQKSFVALRKPVSAQDGPQGAVPRPRTGKSSNRSNEVAS